MFFQHFKDDNPGEEALAFREEMRKQQANAEAADAPSRAATTFGKAMEIAQQGQQEYEEGKYTAAKLSFESAAEFFGIAAAEALEYPNTSPPEDNENRQKQAALSAESEMRSMKAQAIDARAPTLASELFKAGAQEEEQAEIALSAGDYARAKSLYDKAGGSFKESRDEAQAKNMAAKTDLSSMRRQVESYRQEMLREKTAARQVDSENLAPQLYENALERERAGDRYVQAGTRGGYQDAQKAYVEAKDGYRKAGETARTLAQSKITEAEKTAREMEATNELRRKTEEARTDMEEVKRMVAGSFSEKAANPVYKKASGREADAENSLRNGEYGSAMESFREARELYVQASEEIALMLNERSQKNNEEKKMRAAEEAIRSLIVRFERGLEEGDLNTLGALRENESGWAEFFRTVRDVSVNINERNKQISPERGTALVSFQVSMSYFNRTYKKTEKRDFSRDWELEFINGGWRITAARFY